MAKKRKLFQKKPVIDLAVGDKIEIVEIKNEPQYFGRVGEVTSIQGNEVYGTWGDCEIIFGQDSYVKIDKN